MTEVEGEFKVLDEMCNKCSVHIRMWPDGVRFCPECHKVWWPEKNTLKDYTVKELLEHILSRPEEELKDAKITIKECCSVCNETIIKYESTKWFDRKKDTKEGGVCTQCNSLFTEIIYDEGRMGSFRRCDDCEYEEWL